MTIFLSSAPCGAAVNALAEPGTPQPSGRLVLIVGPSSAGKDTLLRFAQIRLQHRDDILFPRRVITRPPDASEIHEPITSAAFEARRSAGDFALDWIAHGLSYGIPAMISDAIADGRTVVVNVSRNVVATARTRFPTFVIAIEAGHSIRALRLAHRARELSDDQTERLARGTAPVEPDAVIVNDGPIAAVAQHLIRLIAG